MSVLVKCDLCSSTGRMVMTKNNRTICEDPVACVRQAREFKWWRAKEYVKREG